jgi:ribosomal protein S18 acetylase RimI-like enzyme
MVQVIFARLLTPLEDSLRARLGSVALVCGGYNADAQRERTAMTVSLTPETARAEDLPAAFRLLFGDLPPADRDARLVNFLRLAASGEIDPQGVFVLRARRGVAGCILAVPVPGAAAILWPPVSLPDQQASEREDLLLQHACAWLRQRGVKVAQALLGPEEAHLGGPLARNGLPHVTDLYYLQHDLRSFPREPAPHLRFSCYDPQHPHEFHATLVQTYEETFDCPEMTGARTIEEVIAGHRAQGEFDAHRWWLARWEDDPVGVVLTLRVPESGDHEVAYMGLIPRARGRGLGRELLVQALGEARRASAPRVLLSVDGRNSPARRLYEQVGFTVLETRAVYLAVWSRGSYLAC